MASAIRLWNAQLGDQTTQIRSEQALRYWPVYEPSLKGLATGRTPTVQKSLIWVLFRLVSDDEKRRMSLSIVNSLRLSCQALSTTL